jgi:hypothetical protein
VDAKAVKPKISSSKMCALVEGLRGNVLDADESIEEISTLAVIARKSSSTGVVASISDPVGAHMPHSEVSGRVVSGELQSRALAGNSGKLSARESHRLEIESEIGRGS